MSTISQVPREEVPHIWETVAPMIERAIEYNQNRHDIVDVFADILQRTLTLWVAMDDDAEIIGCAVIRIYEAPLSRIMVFEYLAGDNVDTWLDEGATTLNDYAFNQKCDWMECRGRFGWVPRLKKYGWESKAVFFERKVSDPTKVHHESEEGN